MLIDLSDDSAIFKVVMNAEELYSIWPVDREPPNGWHATEFTGTRDECLAHIEEVWTDMRPKSLRDRMENDTR